MRKFSLLTLVALLMLVFSCDKDKNDDVVNADEMGKVRFNFSLANQTGDAETVSRLKSAPGFDQVRTVVLSIEKGNGDATDYKETKVPLNDMTADFFDQNLPLGDYKLTLCTLLDMEDNTIYATPLAGSQEAPNVDNPLSVDFTVKQGQQTNVPIDIVPTFGLNPEAFGLAGFPFSPATFSFYINVIEKGQVGNFLAASLTVSKDTYTKSHEISANMINYIIVKDGLDDYTLTVTKPGFKTYTTTILSDDLKSYTANPLSIELEREFIFGTVTTATGRIWLDRNLGASRVATSPTDEAAYGDLYQWGRPADGHQKRTSATTTTLSSTDVPGHANFITTQVSPHDWRNPQNYNLWVGVNGTNNTCPSGFRIPTEEEWEAEKATWDSQDATGAFSSPLKLTSGGVRAPFDPEIKGVGEDGYYWMICPLEGEGYCGSGQIIYRTHIYEIWNSPGFGFSVRCIKD